MDAWDAPFLLHACLFYRGLWLEEWSSMLWFGGIYGILVEPSLTKYGKSVGYDFQFNGFEYWTWPADRSGSLVNLSVFVVLLSTLVPKLCWFYGVCISRGMFSIKSTWEAIKLVCGSFMIPRHSFIPWLAVFDRLATRQRQLRWGRSSDDKCLFCNSSSECRDHFFFLALLRWVYGRVFSIVQRQVGDWPMEFQWAEVWKRNSSSLYHS